MVLGQEGFNFERMLGGLILDKQGRVKVDPGTGEFIPGEQRRSAQNVKKNPLGLNAGNAINPDVSFFTDILAKSNQKLPGADQDLLSKAGFA